MNMKQRLDDDIKKAMKAKDRQRTDCLRMLKSKILEKEVGLRAKQGKDYSLTDEEAVEVIGSYAKQRRDSIDSYRKGGRADLVANEEAELAIVGGYLPEQLGEDEVREIVQAAVAESGATAPSQMGLVMKAVMPRVKGKADGKLVNRLVREALTPDS